MKEWITKESKRGNGIYPSRCYEKVQELVRCKDCKHWSYGKDLCNLHDMGMVADDFCSYGERKADD